eukprot:PhF_6_TR4204/c0_g1_i1/m.5652
MLLRDLETPFLISASMATGKHIVEVPVQRLTSMLPRHKRSTPREIMRFVGNTFDKLFTGVAREAAYYAMRFGVVYSVTDSVRSYGSVAMVGTASCTGACVGVWRLIYAIACDFSYATRVVLAPNSRGIPMDWLGQRYETAVKAMRMGFVGVPMLAAYNGVAVGGFIALRERQIVPGGPPTLMFLAAFWMNVLGTIAAELLGSFHIRKSMLSESTSTLFLSSSAMRTWLKTLKWITGKALTSSFGVAVVMTATDIQLANIRK